MNLIVRAEAEADIADAVAWYEQRQPGLGQQLIDEVRSAAQNALLHPRRYPLLRRKPEVRRTLTERFPYRVFYIVLSDTLVVFRILHSARHDREWKKAVRESGY